MILLYGISCGLHGYIIQGDSRLLQGMIQVTNYTGVPCIYYKEATDGIFRLFRPLVNTCTWSEIES